MAAGDVKIAYAASANLVVTNLASLAASATWVAGWESALVDNTSNLYLDYLLSGKITVGNGPTAGQIRVYVIAMLDDSNWPDVLDGTESAETISSVMTRDNICKLGAVISADATVDAVYHFGPFSVANLFGGKCPAKFVVFITHSLVQALAAAGQQVTQKGVYDTVAQ